MRTRAALCLLLVLLLSACAKPQQAQSETVLPGYIGAGETAFGGSAEGVGDLNLKSLAVSAEAVEGVTETVLTMRFVSGSRMSGGAAETEGGGVPVYSVYTLDAPARLFVSFDNLAYWDYSHALEWNDPLVSGAFQYSLFENPRVNICFQLTGPVNIKAAEEGDTLTIRLRPKAEEDKPQYFVTMQAFEDYCAGNVSAEIDASPTFASDLSNKLLISPPFPTEADAKVYLENAKANYPQIPGAHCAVVTLGAAGLPEFNAALNYLTAMETPAVRHLSGAELTLPALVPDGLYLCDLPNSEGILCSRELPAAAGEAPYQELYIVRPDGQTTLAMSFEFSAIEKAQYSPDGRKLAVLERASGSTHLYVFDADTYELLNDLSEMGFGGNTSTFIWNSLGTTIYAITGVSGIELHQFDYSIPDEASRHSLVDRNSVDEGSLGFYDGELYFAHATMEGGSMLYRIKPEGGIRKPFRSGGRFVISSDARYMAIVESSEGTAAASKGSALTLYETATGNTATITDEFYPYDAVFSKDCMRLYYIESRISGGQTEDTGGEGELADDTADTEDAASPAPAESATPAQTPESVSSADPYPYTLWVYDIAAGKSERLLDLSAPELYAGSRNDTLILNRYETDDSGTLIRAAYLLDLNALPAADAEAAQ
ncbi:MAG TPA: hypothetical protein VN366_05785 [Feifaniaceae bacterium]|nr:hypothetical protein [Feifaniaceae bacterium]